MALMKCPECGQDVSDKAESCPNCGYKILQAQKEQTTDSEWISSTAQIQDQHQNQIQKQPKKKHGCLTAVVIFIVLCAVISKFGGSDEEKESKKTSTEMASESSKPGTDKVKENKSDKKVTKEQNQTKEKSKKDLKEWQKEYKDSSIQYVDIKFLYKNAEYYMNSSVISYGTICDILDGDLQFDTDKDNFFKEITCKFKNKEDISGIKKEDKVCFIGKVSDSNSFFGTDTITLDNCFLVTKGKDVSTYEKKIKKASNSQKKFVSDAKKKQKEKKKKASNNKKNSYIEKCKEYPYKKIQRKPDKYDGKNIKVSGTVIQVSEGWFDTVTLRVEDTNGDIWYISYSYSDGEDKILEDDKITIYGECTGTETYITILGGTATIPSIDGEYID